MSSSWCVCDHPRADHVQNRKDCREPGCDCNAFEPRPAVPPLFEERLSPAEAEVLAAAQPGPDTLSTSARLAKAERERDEARAEVDSVRAALNNAIRCYDELQTTAGGLHDEIRILKRSEGLDVVAARAELASARQELERLRTATGWIVARKGGRYCERCEQEVRRGEAYELEPGTSGLILHVQCPDVPAQVHAYPALYCVTCYSRILPAGDRDDREDLMPFNLNPRQLALADRQILDVRRAVDALIAAGPSTSDDSIVVAVEMVQRITASAIALAADSGRDPDGPLLAIAAELLRRALTTNQGAPA